MSAQIQGVPNTERVITYIDGFNLYFGLRDRGWRRLLWLDLSALSQRLLKPGQILEGVKYFTSRVSGQGAKQQRQSPYIDALGTVPRIDIFYGKYISSPRICRNCNAIDDVPSEKMTDVNIAVELLSDAFDNAFETALLVSGDSDLSGPIMKIREKFSNKRVVVAFPPNRVSKQLRSVAQSSFVIRRSHIASSQFPAKAETASGTHSPQAC